jgi:hypothetical protein
MRQRRRSVDTAPVRLVVLVVGISPQFLERFRMAAAPRKAEILSCEEETFRRTAALRVPRTILVSAQAYARAPTTYDAVTDELCARHVQLESEEMLDEEIEALVRTTVRWA